MGFIYHLKIPLPYIPTMHGFMHIPPDKYVEFVEFVLKIKVFFKAKAHVQVRAGDVRCAGTVWVDPEINSDC